MGEITRKIDVEKLISYSDDLVEVLKDRRDFNSLTQCLDDSKSLHSCEADFNAVLNSVQDYEKKIEFCKQKTKRAKSEVAAEAEVDRLQKELEEGLEKEGALREELRDVSNEIKGLEREWIAIEEQKRARKKSQKDELRARMKLSMYASVTNIIPNLDDQSKISGCILLFPLLKVILFFGYFQIQGCLLMWDLVRPELIIYLTDIGDEGKNVIEKFEYDPAKKTTYDTCDNMWKTINT